MHGIFCSCGVFWGGRGLHDSVFLVNCVRPAFPETGRDSASLTWNVGVNSCKAPWPVPPAEDSFSPVPARSRWGSSWGQPKGAAADLGDGPDREVSWAGLCGLCLSSFCIFVSVCQRDLATFFNHFSQCSHF